MKKIAQKQKQYNQKAQFKKAFYERKEAALKKHKSRNKFIKKRLSNPKQRKKTVKQVLAPEEFSLINFEIRDKLIIFLNKINSFLLQGHNVHILFNDTSRLLPCGTLWATANVMLQMNLDFDPSPTMELRGTSQRLENRQSHLI